MRERVRGQMHLMSSSTSAQSGDKIVLSFKIASAIKLNAIIIILLRPLLS